MAKTFILKILTPSKMVVNEEVEKVFVNTINGMVEFLPNHAPIIMSTVPSVTVFYDKVGTKKELFTSRGVINLSNNEIMFCSDAAELVEDIDLARAEEAKGRAEERLKDSSKFDVARAQAALIRANIRIGLKKHSI